ncbi:hypothetical protein D3C80_747880 [compost metagenome]
MTQNREFTAKGQHKNSHVDQADTGVHPIPLDAASQQNGGNHGENHPRHAEEGVGEQQACTALTAFIHVGNQERTDGHGDPADQAQHKHRGGEQRDTVADHQSRYGRDHQDKAEAQLRFQRHDFHQPGIQENGDQNTGVKEGKGVAHAGNGELEIVGDITHHHSGDDHQCAGQGVREEADPCELNAIAVSHVWPVNLPRVLHAAKAFAACLHHELIRVMKSKTR